MEALVSVSLTAVELAIVDIACYIFNFISPKGSKHEINMKAIVVR